MPARLPNVLLNGTRASRWACPRTSRLTTWEVAPALMRLLDEPGRDAGDLMKYVKGPDFPLGGELYRRRADLAGDLQHRQRQFHGARGLRGSRTASHRHLRTSLPGLGRQSARADRGANDARRSCRWSRTSATSPTTRIRRARHRAQEAKATSTQLMAHLFATTDLERTYRVNMNVIGLRAGPG